MKETLGVGVPTPSVEPVPTSGAASSATGSENAVLMDEAATLKQSVAELLHVFANDEYAVSDDGSAHDLLSDVSEEVTVKIGGNNCWGSMNKSGQVPLLHPLIPNVILMWRPRSSSSTRPTSAGRKISCDYG